MTEFLLHGLALQELEIVDQQHIDSGKLVLEGNGVLLPQCHDETDHETLGGEKHHLAVGPAVANALGYGGEQMRLAKTRGGMNKQRIETDRGALGGICHTAHGGMGQLVRRADDKTVETLTGIKRQAAVGAHSRRGGCHR